MSEQVALDLESPAVPSTVFSPGDRVSVPLYGARAATGRVEAVDSHTSPHAPYSPLLWVLIQEGPGWAVGEVWSFYADRVEAS